MNDETIIDGGNPAVEPAPEPIAHEPDPVAELTPEQIEEQKQAEEAERKRKTGSQRAREKAERLERENQALRDALARSQKVSEPEQEAYKPKTADGRPDPEDPRFKTYEEYLDAVTDWKVDQKLKEKEAQRSAQEQEESFRSRMQTAHQAHPDLSDLLDDLEDAGVPPPTDTMHRVIMASDLGSELLYHLAKNPTEIKRIGALPPVAQALEMGVLLGQLRSSDSKAKTEPKPETKPSNAPPPPRPVKATGVAVVDESKLSDADWLKAQSKKR